MKIRSIIHRSNNIISEGSYTGIPPSVSFVDGGGNGATATVNYHGASAFANLPTYNLDQFSHIVMLNNKEGQGEGLGYVKSGTLAHEIGHNLDLVHTYSGGGASAICNHTDINYLLDIHGTPPPGNNCPHGHSWGADNLTNTPPKVTNNLMGGNQTLRYLSPMQIGIVHRSLSLRSVRKYVMDSPYDLEPYLITSDETWDFDIRWYSDIIVKSGNTLTITCRVLMPDQGRIIVEPGAKLVVDEGVITAGHGMWQGIIVLGTPTQNQSWPTSAHQGIVELKNDAVIEHAKVGISVFDPAHAATTGGGIVKASSNALFRNCRKAVAFGPFSKHANLSAFTDVRFLADAPLNDPSYGGIATPEFVSLWNVHRVVFTDCVFEFEKDNAAFATPVPTEKWPTAITSHFGGYRLQKSSTGVGNSFVNLQNGLYGYSNWGIKDRVYSSYSTFENVYRGAYLAGMNGAVMEYGMHHLPDQYTVSTPNVHAIGYMGDMNVGYRIRHNTYVPITSGTMNRGVVVNGTLSTGSYSGGLVYDNTFNGIFTATQLEQGNLYAQISCNTYDGNGLDWAVNPVSQGYLADQGTMCPTPTPGATDGQRAGNTFLGNSLPFSIYEFSLLDLSTYFAAGGTDNPNTVPLPSGDNLVVQGDLQGCDMQVIDPSCEPSSGGVVEYWDSQRRASNETWSGKMADLDSLVAHLDSSRTQLMLDTIANLHTNDTVLRTVLLAHTPLSDTVLMAYLDRDTVITTTNFETVMLANLPASHTVWGALTAWLDGKGDKWPDVADTLRWAQRGNLGVTTATSLNREIRYHGGRTHQFADEVVLHYVENDAIDSAKAYMDTVGLYTMRLALLGTELSDGNWDGADSSLAKLPLKTVNDTAVYDLFHMLIALGRDTLTILDMSSADSLRVQQIAADTTLDAAVMAKGILSVLLDTMYLGMPEEIPMEPSARHGEEEEAEEEVVSPTRARYFKAYPNPFNSNTTVEYDLGKECEFGCEFRLFDLQGRVVFQQRIRTEDGKGLINIDLSGYGSGIYYCALYGNTRLLQTEKLILLR